MDNTVINSDVVLCYFGSIDIYATRIFGDKIESPLKVVTLAFGRPADQQPALSN